jgi:cytosine/adenosine deaminase-related metal-dependent hydrolase
MRQGIADAHASGTLVFGDISNTLVSVDALVASAVAAVVFYELIRFNCPDPDAVIAEALATIRGLTVTERVRVALAAHAPYSVAPALFDAIRAAADRTPRLPYSVHLAESREEGMFIQSGEGPWRTVLESVGSWDASWSAPGKSPVEYLQARGFLGPRLLTAHGVQMSASDLRTLAAQGTTLVTCPRSNLMTGVGSPPLEAFYASGVRVAVGTDSLASCPDLNLFSELAAMRAIAPSLPAGRLLESATLTGAHALGFDQDYGSIEPGKRAPLLAVTLPPGVDDVEQYLVGGVASEQVKWVGHG